ncbi:PIN domain-like protein [Rozella allomycis CSF55]|uniref:PIN domain-like protein n=1 Tax=Rozella allomycis (strain CSF55) TaxID=988480 RepID=A0A4P9YRF4_ROZAC|nr:PIN domain-like protein [Rozella allomycis CSF55]
MGITGLLGCFKSVINPYDLEKLKGCKVAIDGYSWLYKGSYSCAMDLCLNIDTRMHINYCVKKAKELVYFGIQPYFVFDGCSLPMKKRTEEKRSLSKEKAMELGHKYLKLKNLKAAFSEFTKAVSIKPEYVYQLVQELKKEGITYVIAPYEADAQMTYLVNEGIVDAAISEDSDLIVFGCKRTFYKCNGANAHELRFQDIFKTTDWTISHLTFEQLQYTCILSGCDYLESIQGVGLKTALKYVTKGKTIENIFMEMKNDGKDVSDEYIEDFEKAVCTFKFQRVFDPRNNRLTTLNPLPSHIDTKKIEFIGPYMTDEVATQLAQCKINPKNMKPFTSIESQSSQPLQNLTSKMNANTTMSPLEKRGPLDKFFSIKTRTSEKRTLKSTSNAAEAKKSKRVDRNSNHKVTDLQSPYFL